MRRAAVLLALVAGGCGSGGAMAVTAVDPSVASALEATALTIRGRGFSGVVSTSIDTRAGASVDNRFAVRVGATTLDAATVERLDDATLMATLPAGLPPGTYDVVVTAPDGKSASLPQSLRIAAPAALAASASVTPATIAVGDDFELVLAVANQGDTTALGVAPTTPAQSGSGTAALVSAPAPADLAGNASAAPFVFHYRAVAAGTLTLAASVAGTDAAGHAVKSDVTSATTTIVSGPSLTASVAATPAAVVVGQTVTLTATVVNGGPATAHAATPTVTLGGSGTLAPTSGPTPAQADLAPGATQTFTWQWRAAAAGSVSLTVDVAATDGGGNAIAAPSASTSVTVGTAAALQATLALPSTLTRGQAFTATMTVTDVGGDTVNAVTPSALTASGSGAVRLVSGPTPASATLAPAGTTTFSWSYVATSDGTLQLAGTVTGSDAVTSSPVSASAPSNQATISDVEVIGVNPFGDGTSFSFVFAYDGFVYLGPRANGTGAVRMNPDGSAPQSVSFTIARDNNMSNGSTPPYASIGYTGCTLNTAQCGPDNENGRGTFATGVINGTPWLVYGGSRSGGGEDFVYLTSDTTTSPSLAYDWLGGQVEGSTRALTAAHVFNNHVYLGWANTGGQRPVLGRLETIPSPPGQNATTADFTNFRADQMPGMQTSTLSMTDVIDDFANRLYFADDGAWYRSNDAAPSPYGVVAGEWVAVTPSSTDYTAKPSLATTKLADYEPADRAVAAFAAFNGRYYAARNTTAGPQLWMCNPALTGSSSDCDPGDWSLIVRNSTGDTALSQFNDTGNATITMLVATSGHLYVGYNDAAGIELFRSTAAQPLTAADFEGQNGCVASSHPQSCAPLAGAGVGDPTNDTRIFSAIATTFAGHDDVYVVTGTGTNGVRVVRIAE